VAHAATIQVTTLFDTDLLDGLCSLREALVAANTDLPYRDCAAGNGADRIVIDLAGEIALAAGLPMVEENLEIAGPASGILWIDGSNLHRPLLLDSPGDDQSLALRRLRIRDGYSAVGGGGLSVAAGDSLLLEEVTLTGNESGDDGGALLAQDAALVVVRRSTIQNNVANGSGAGAYLDGGTLLIEDSLVAGNVSGGPTVATSGGGLFVVGADATLRRSTFSGNRSEGSAGVNVGTDAVVTFEFSTVTANVCDTIANPGAGSGCGVGVASNGQVDFTGTLVAANVEESTAGSPEPDVFCGIGTTVTSSGHNLIGAHDGCAPELPASPGPGLPNLDGDFVGTAAAPFDPGLGGLLPNGGPTRSHLPLAGSLAVDHGNCPAEPHDQRGWGNPATGLRTVDNPAVPDFGDGCDIGAAEAGAAPLPEPVFADGFESGNPGAWSSVVP
jgi:CSLREA domain-containing protein